MVSHALAQSGQLRELLVHTGQHFDANMSDVFFNELGMHKPAYQLDIHGGTHGAMMGRMLADVENVLLKEKPAAVLVYGDTNYTLAGYLLPRHRPQNTLNGRAFRLSRFALWEM